MSNPADRKTSVQDGDDDLDDLDDVLEQFTAKPAPKPAASQPAPQPIASASQAPVPADPKATKANADAEAAALLESLDLSDDFARELSLGMESLMREIAGPAPAGAGDPEREQAFKAAWEAMLVDGMNGLLSPDAVAAAGSGSAPQQKTAAQKAGTDKTASAGEEGFQESIRKAMEKMKESDAKAQADATTGQGDDSLEALLSQLRGDIGEGGESEEELQGLLESMMGQLMSKEVLYEPLKELNDKFPTYLAENSDKISAEDKTRYAAQHKVVAQIVQIFEDPAYSDEDTEKSTQVVELMQEMQNHGSPPAEIMGPLPPGFDLGPDGLPKLGGDCTIS